MKKSYDFSKGKRAPVIPSTGENHVKLHSGHEMPQTTIEKKLAIMAGEMLLLKGMAITLLILNIAILIILLQSLVH